MGTAYNEPGPSVCFSFVHRIEVSVMKKICGFAMFWVAVGMVVMMFIPDDHIIVRADV